MRSLARSTGLPLIATSVAKWFANSPGYLDSVIKQIDEVFTSARAAAPAIIFLDEIDAVPNRATLSRRGADWWTPVITHLLTTLDGTNAEATAKLIIVGATNHPDRLDEALIRPGRLSRVIEIGAPDEKALIGIFRQHLGSDLAGADLADAGRLAFGSLATGAKVVEWVRAARRAARHHNRPMAMADLLLAVAPDDSRSEADRRRAAVHEAGHAVVAYLTGSTPVGISMIEDARRDGFTMFENARLETRGNLENLITQFLAGRAAEELVLGEPSAGAGMIAGSDLDRATKFAGALHLSSGLGEQLRFQVDVDNVLGALTLDRAAGERVEGDLRRLYIRAIGLSEEALRTVMWKTEWCVRFHAARRAAAPRISPKMTHQGLAAFIEQERENMNRWYIRQFREPRRIGRPIKVGAAKEPKPYDYPSPTTLRNWLRIFATTGERMVAFAPRYHRCGNRRQLDSELAAAIDTCVMGYADLSRPTRQDIYDQVEIATKKLNIKRERAGLPALPQVSPTTVNRRIAKLEPFFVDAGRLGRERAMRRYLPVGMGAKASRPLERVEIDDWEADDLHAVMATTQLWTG